MGLRCDALANKHAVVIQRAVGGGVYGKVFGV